MQPSNNSNISSQLRFFSQLPSNTDVHFSKTHNSFIITGGACSFLPGFQSVANLYKGHNEENLAKDLKQLTREIFKALDTQLSSAQNDEKKCAVVAKELQTLSDEFEAAVRGPASGNGGLFGLSKIHGICVERFIRNNRAIISSAQNCIEEGTLSVFEGDQLDKSISSFTTLIPTIDREDAHQMGQFLSSRILDTLEEEAKTEEVGYLKVFLYKISLAYNAAMNTVSDSWAWWNEVPLPGKEEKIFLGALPLIRSVPGCPASNDLEILTKEHNIGAVLSVVEPFEMRADGYLCPVHPIQWEDAGVLHRQLPTEDFKTMPISLIEEGVAFLHECVQKNIPVYIHCKAGRGRSALVLTCYLIKYHNFSAEQAIAYIKIYRPQAGLEKAKMDTAKSYEDKIVSDFVHADLEKKKLKKLETENPQ